MTGTSFDLLQGEGLLSEERTDLLLSWRHTGFSVHNRVRVEPEDPAAVERLARYILRPPISLERMRWSGEGEVSYRRKAGHDGESRQAQGEVPVEVVLYKSILCMTGLCVIPIPALGPVLRSRCAKGNSYPLLLSRIVAQSIAA